MKASAYYVQEYAARFARQKRAEAGGNVGSRQFDRFCKDGEKAAREILSKDGFCTLVAAAHDMPEWPQASEART